jgi:hypothetical protein
MQRFVSAEGAKTVVGGTAGAINSLQNLYTIVRIATLQTSNLAWISLRA